MTSVLEHIRREHKTGLTTTAVEICEVLQLDMEEVRKRTARGRLRFDEVDGLRYYDVMDLINLKDSLDRQTIFRQTMDQAIPDTAIKIER